MFAVDSLFGLGDWQFWISAVWFGVAFIFSFFLPGLVLLKFSNLPKKYWLLVAPVLGLAVWSLSAYILGFLGLRFLMYLFVGVFGILAWQMRRKLIPFKFPVIKNKLTWAILGVGVFLQLFPVVGSGWLGEGGVGYYWINGFDGIFHLALSKELIDHFPPMQPGAVGLALTNYHYLSNLAVGEIARVWGLPLNHLYFQFFPLVFSPLFGFLIIALMDEWSGKIAARNWALLFFYLAGEMSWLASTILKTVSENAWGVYADHGMLQFLNPPQAFAKITLMAGLLMMHFYWAKKSWREGVFLGLLFGTLVGYKIYFGIGVALGLACIYLFLLVGELLVKFKQKKIKNLLPFLLNKYLTDFILLVIFAVVSSILFFPANAGAGGLFFDFLTWPKLLLGAEKLNWQEWWLRLQVYEAHGNIKALTVWYGLAAGIFLFSLYHLRLLSLFTILPKLRQKMRIEELIFIFVPAVIMTLVGMNFLQVSGLYNTFNFFVVAIFLLNLLTALVFSQMKGKKFWPFFVLIIVLMFAQTAFLFKGYLKNYLVRGDRKLITTSHLEAMNYLKTTPDDSVIQTHSGNFMDYYSPYLYFFSSRYSYFGGRQILESHNQPIKERQELMEELFPLVQTASVSAKLAREIGIDYLLLETNQWAQEYYYDRVSSPSAVPVPCSWKTVFKNDEVAILELEVVDEVAGCE